MADYEAMRPGDVVVATRDGSHDRQGLPLARPMTRRLYRIETIYPMDYGLGCTLRGLDPRPYRGYLLFVKSGIRFARPGWYFRPIDVAPAEWSQELKQFLESRRELVRDTQRPADGGDRTG